jgi:heme oxygenase
VSGVALRQRLREATNDVHLRLHRHSGLSAAAAGTIDIAGYRALLARLYGFHRAFEVCVGARSPETGAARSALLESDLAALGVTTERRQSLPLCARLPSFCCDAERLGALYVVEGSALGGQQIARALRPVLQPLGGAGCRFFSNDGASRHGWTEILARIEGLRGDPDHERAVITSAVKTFEAFEDWMADWAPDSAAGKHAEIRASRGAP